MVAENKPLKLRDVDVVLGILSGYGQKETGLSINNFDVYIAFNDKWPDLDARVKFLDAEEIDSQVIYPSLGIVWEGEIDDVLLADALCRAYNTWAFELCASHKNRLFPPPHISLRDPALAVKELQRLPRLGFPPPLLPPLPI